jgi:hypothetical protein
VRGDRESRRVCHEDDTREGGVSSGFRKEWSWTEPPPAAWGLIRSEDIVTLAAAVAGQAMNVFEMIRFRVPEIAWRRERTSLCTVKR